MARTKQTARKSTSAKAPRKQLAFPRKPLAYPRKKAIKRPMNAAKAYRAGGMFMNNNNLIGNNMQINSLGNTNAEVETRTRFRPPVRTLQKISKFHMIGNGLRINEDGVTEIMQRGIKGRGIRFQDNAYHAFALIAHQYVELHLKKKYGIVL